MRAVAQILAVTRRTFASFFVAFSLVGAWGGANPLSAQEDALEALKEIAVIDELVMMPSVPI